VKKKLALALALLVFAAFAIYMGGAKKAVEVKGLIASCTQIPVNSSVTEGTQVPCIDGGPGVIMESIKGPAVINVWGSWCAPCVAEMPHFIELANTKKVTSIGVDVEEKDSQAGKKFIRTHGITWPVLFDPDSRTKSLYGIGVPVTWFINAQGEVAYRHAGIIASKEILFSEVKKYLGITV
jgi:thiol-disulfide isomerase/thioredoxin